MKSRMTVAAAVFLLLACLPAAVRLQAQTTYMPIDRDIQHLADRVETLSGACADSLFQGVMPLSRKSLVRFLAEKVREERQTLNKQDIAGISRVLAANSEWAPEIIPSKQSWFGTFYTTPADFIRVQQKHFFLSVNPAFRTAFISEQQNTNVIWNNSYGLELRGRVANTVGFYAHVTNHHETAVSFVDAWKRRRNAVPGAGPFKDAGQNSWEYMQVAAHVDVPLLKNYITATAGFGKHFIGDGIRSLFISDFAAPAPFLRINTRIWKLNYQNLYMELIPQHGSTHRRKYMTMHHLSVNATRWLNIGLFETVVFGRSDRFEFGYMNPIIFYRQTERALGSPDKVSLGINFKAIALKQFQLYGQFLLNEFTAKEFFSTNGYWANKWGMQAGAKYFNAFAVKNLDLQAEVNLIRPYTYTHRDTVTNFTHYNQPLAHPLGAGIREITGQIRYQPHRDLHLVLSGSYYQQGVDTGTANFGNDIFRSYNDNVERYGVHMVHGVKIACASLGASITYRIRAGLFADIGVQHRNYAYANGLFPDFTTTYVYGGLRLNMQRRIYDFY